MFSSSFVEIFFVNRKFFGAISLPERLLRSFIQHLRKTIHQATLAKVAFSVVERKREREVATPCRSPIQQLAVLLYSRVQRKRIQFHVAKKKAAAEPATSPIHLQVYASGFLLLLGVFRFSSPPPKKKFSFFAFPKIGELRKAENDEEMIEIKIINKPERYLNELGRHNKAYPYKYNIHPPSG